MTGVNLGYLTALLVIPGLIGLLMLMEWLETHIARRMMADEIEGILRANKSIDDLELGIARASEPIIAGLHRRPGS